MECQQCGTEHKDGAPGTCTQDVPPAPVAATPGATFLRWQVSPWVINFVWAGVIALFILIIAPRPHDHRRLYDSCLKGNLRQLRDQIIQFHADAGQYPTVLEDLVASDESALKTKVKSGTYKGPYLTPKGGIGGTGIPSNPYSDPTSNRIADHWKYDPATGKVTVPNKLAHKKTADDNVLFSQL